MSQTSSSSTGRLTAPKWWRCSGWKEKANQNSPTPYLVVFVVVHILSFPSQVLHPSQKLKQSTCVSRNFQKHKHWVCFTCVLHKCHSVFLVFLFCTWYATLSDTPRHRWMATLSLLSRDLSTIGCKRRLSFEF